MNSDFIFVIDQEENLTIIPFNEVGQIKIFVTEYKTFQLIWFQNNYDYVLYETKDEDEILQARDYVYEKILQKGFSINLSTNDWMLEKIDLD